MLSGAFFGHSAVVALRLIFENIFMGFLAIGMEGSHYSRSLHSSEGLGPIAVQLRFHLPAGAPVSTMSMLLGPMNVTSVANAGLLT
jgi:hypothetical protein